MRERHAPDPPGQTAEPAAGLGQRRGEELDPPGRLHQRADDQPGPEGETERGEDLAGAEGEIANRRGQQGRACRQPQPLQGAGQVAPLPGQQRAHRRQDQAGAHQEAEHQREIGRADRDRLPCKGLIDEGIKGAEQHRQGGGGQEEVVQHQHAFPADRREQAPGRKLGGAPREQRKPCARAAADDAEQQDAPGRIDREGVHRG